MQQMYRNFGVVFDGNGVSYNVRPSTPAAVPTFIADGESLSGDYLNVVGSRNFTVSGDYAKVQGESDFHVKGDYCEILSGDRVHARGDYLKVYSTNGTVKGDYNDIYGRGNRITGDYNKDHSREEEARAVLARLHQGPVERVLAPSRPAPTYPAMPNDPEALLDDDADETLLCTLCMSRKKNTTVVPCGHVYMCVTCAATSKPVRCGMCRKDVLMVIAQY